MWTGRQRSIGAVRTVAPALGESIAVLFASLFAFKTTVTGKVADEAFVRWSAAEQVTVVVPTANSEPGLGAQATKSGPSTASYAVAL